MNNIAPTLQKCLTKKNDFQNIQPSSFQTTHMQNFNFPTFGSRFMISSVALPDRRLPTHISKVTKSHPKGYKHIEFSVG